MSKWYDKTVTKDDKKASPINIPTMLCIGCLILISSEALRWSRFEENGGIWEAGQRRNDGRFHGWGITMRDNGNLYIGQYENGSPHDYGCKFVDGLVASL